MTEQKIALKLDLSQINQILQALGELPFAQVHELIGDIQLQAQAQLEATEAGGAADKSTG